MRSNGKTLLERGLLTDIGRTEKTSLLEQRSAGREPANIWRDCALGKGPVQSPEVGVLGRFQKEQKGSKIAVLSEGESGCRWGHKRSRDQMILDLRGHC